MKKSKWFVILLSIFLVLLAGFTVFKGVAELVVGNGMHHGQAFRQGPHGGPLHHHRMALVGGYTLFGLFSMIGLLFKIGLIMVGWFLWKKSSGMKKWVGALFAIVGIFALLPWFFALPLCALIGYVMMKKQYSSPIENLEVATTASETMILPNIQTADYLDQWERTVNREEK
ncbi:hypothetical protein FZW96_18080 [Bacillus sp. BGMRC 2118]|nr:hypothetical protein FZW96_18080 [Bacillus sp. BGMRC 2118]